MATTTPTYSWPVPTSTDYVADGAVAIEALGDAIDSSLNGITGGKNVGLQYITETTFTSQASVIFDGVFSSSYLSYVMIGNFSVAANSNLNINLRNGGADLGGTSYSSSWYYNQQTGGTAGADFAFGGSNINMQKSNVCRGFYGRVEFFQPFTNTFTHFNWHSTQFDLTTPFGFTGTGSDSAARVANGFKINTPSSTMTGSIKIYGLRN
jgi:hypothetical protein